MTSKHRCTEGKRLQEDYETSKEHRARFTEYRTEAGRIADGKNLTHAIRRLNNHLSWCRDCQI